MRPFRSPSCLSPAKPRLSVWRRRSQCCVDSNLIVPGQCQGMPLTISSNKEIIINTYCRHMDPINKTVTPFTYNPFVYIYIVRYSDICYYFQTSIYRREHARHFARLVLTSGTTTPLHTATRLVLATRHVPQGEAPAHRLGPVPPQIARAGYLAVSPYTM
jgi:hypothetical protein